MEKESLCKSCEYLTSIDVDGNIACLIGISGREKVYCVSYRKKGD
jgi:hypothetical protein